MSIGGDPYPWNEKNVNAIAQDAGVYAFFDGNNNLIYVGQSQNLRERFQGYWSSDFDENPCLKSTKTYRKEFTNNSEEREKELLDEYEREQGRLPSCNTQHPD